MKTIKTNGIEIDLGGSVDGIKIYDPRINALVVSANPALVLADLTQRDMQNPPILWEHIAKMADYCDENLDYAKGIIL